MQRTRVDPARGRLGLLLLLVLLGGALWWSLEGARETARSVAGAGEVERGLEEPAPGIEAPAGARTPLAESPVAPGVEPGRAGRAAARLPTRASARVVDERGLPVAGAELSLAQEPGVRAASGADGVVELALDAVLGAGPTRSLAFALRCPGFASDAREGTVEEGRTLLLGEWPLVAGGSVEGLVLDADGRGIAGAGVACARADLSESDFAARRRDGLEGLGRPGASARTAASGAFRLDGVPAGRIRLVAVKDDRPAARSEPLDVPPGGLASGVELRMEAADGGTDIAGIVLDPDGEPVPLARLTLTGGGSSHRTKAGQDGRFRVHLLDQAEREVAAFDPAQILREAVEHAVKPGTTELVLRLERAPTIELSVATSAGAPVESFAVLVLAESDERVLASWPDGPVPGGRRTLGAPARDFRVEVHANGWLPARLGPFRPADPPAELAVRLERAGGVSGTVWADGQPRAGAYLALHAAVRTDDTYNGFPIRAELRAAVETESGADGAFALSVEEAGDYYLRATAEGYALFELGPLALSPARQREERVELGPGGTLEVRVRSAQAASVAGKLVAFSRGDGLARTERTDGTGLVVVTRLTPGGWQVALATREIQPDSGATYFGTEEAREIPANCRVVAGETTRIDLWLEASAEACRLVGRLVVDGQPATDWLAGLERAGTPVVEPARFAEPGAFRLGVDEPGAYRLSLRTDGADPGALLMLFEPLELHEGERYWSLELDTGALEGTLPPVEPGELVYYRWKRGALEGYAPLVPGDDGRFRCARVPAGRGALVRLDPGRAIEEQTPVVLRELEIEKGSETRIDP